MKLFCSTRHFSQQVNNYTSLLANENREKVIKRLRAVKSLRPPNEDKMKVQKTAAILVPLVEVQGEPALLYTKRSKYLTSHRGQVSFPGGKSDKEDEGPEQTALRECWEEIGIPSNSVEIWATLPPLASSKKEETIYTATPVIGFVNNFNQDNLIVSKDEVEHVFYVKLSVLCDPNNCKYTQFRMTDSNGYSMPLFDVAPFPIWGLTAIITFQVLRAIVPSKLYKHKLSFQTPLTKLIN